MHNNDDIIIKLNFEGLFTKENKNPFFFFLVGSQRQNPRKLSLFFFAIEGEISMESVGAVVAHIQGLSGSFDEVAHLHSLLKQSEDYLTSQGPRLALFLEQLDPAKHSLGYLFLL